jgi:hypothetical protein
MGPAQNTRSASSRKKIDMSDKENQGIDSAATLEGKVFRDTKETTIGGTNTASMSATSRARNVSNILSPNWSNKANFWSLRGAAKTTSEDVLAISGIRDEVLDNKCPTTKFQDKSAFAMTFKTIGKEIQPITSLCTPTDNQGLESTTESNRLEILIHMLDALYLPDIHPTGSATMIRGVCDNALETESITTHVTTGKNTPSVAGAVDDPYNRLKILANICTVQQSKGMVAVTKKDTTPTGKNIHTEGTVAVTEKETTAGKTVQSITGLADDAYNPLEFLADACTLRQLEGTVAFTEKDVVTTGKTVQSITGLADDAYNPLEFLADVCTLRQLEGTVAFTEKDVMTTGKTVQSITGLADDAYNPLEFLADACTLRQLEGTVAFTEKDVMTTGKGVHSITGICDGENCTP